MNRTSNIIYLKGVRIDLIKMNSLKYRYMYKNYMTLYGIKSSVLHRWNINRISMELVVHVMIIIMTSLIKIIYYM